MKLTLDEENHIVGVDQDDSAYDYAGCQIDGYVGYGAITADDYKKIIGDDYVASSAAL